MTKISQAGVHPRIVRCLDSLIDKESWNFYLVFPKADCDLHTFIGTNPNGIPPDILKKQMKGILQGLRQIHMQKIIHRDITPGNILIPDLRKPGLIKITDFGLAESLRAETLRYQPDQLTDVRETCGTPGFIAPEACYWANGQPVVPRPPPISYGYKVSVEPCGLFDFELIELVTAGALGL
jgi:serine/threonine-protein kinase